MTDGRISVALAKARCAVTGNEFMELEPTFVTIAPQPNSGSSVAPIDTRSGNRSNGAHLTCRKWRMSSTLDQIRDQQRDTWDRFSAGWKKWDELVLSWLAPFGEAMIRAIHLLTFVIEVAGVGSSSWALFLRCGFGASDWNKAYEGFRADLGRGMPSRRA